jgi:peptide/nickel transport system substrate-binding protein
MAIQRVRPAFVATNLITAEDRTPRVVLEANRDHNTPRTAHVERVVFVNDLTPAQALEAVCDRDGELDIVTEVSPADAARVEASTFARLVSFDANRLLAGIFNTWPEHDAPLGDRRVREALNLAVDRDRLVAEGLGGHATPMAGLTAPWCNGIFPGAAPRPHDPARARELLAESPWPAGRALRFATPASLVGLAAVIAADIREALALDVDVIEVPEEQLIAGARQLVEKKLTPAWDVLLHAWFDLSSDLPPAVVHREFFGTDGAFRAGPEDPEFDRRFTEIVRQTDPAAATAGAEDLDRYCFDECKALFLCAPKALYAVNRHVRWEPYRATFELADAEVGDQHWSRSGS